MGQILNEVKAITGKQVAKKQDNAKLNFPKLIELIKSAAERGDSHCIVNKSEINEYDKKLLEDEGFSVNITERIKSDYEKYKELGQYSGSNKEWTIRW